MLENTSFGIGNKISKMQTLLKAKGEQNKKMKKRQHGTKKRKNCNGSLRVVMWWHRGTDSSEEQNTIGRGSVPIKVTYCGLGYDTVDCTEPNVMSSHSSSTYSCTTIRNSI